MAQQFNLTAQINLQSPKNVGRVVSDIQRQLKGSGLNTVNIKVKADPRSIAQTNRQLQNVGKNSRAAAKDINTLNRNLQEATRRFSVITIATGTLLSLVTGFKNATKAAIEFERELLKISQVTGKSVQQLQGLTKEVTRLSTAFGVSSADLLNVSRTLAQAGFNAEKTRKSLDILAKTTLAATFDNIQDTTEGAIALLRQFGAEAKRSGGDVAFLEKSLSAINSVSKQFAVESGDLITVIRRVGGVFSAAGGSVNELIALFTSVRATTRESAETIATGLRTIFTRIQRTDTIQQLKALNIELQDSQGRFVGAFEAVRRLSQGLSALDPRDFRFSQIVEQLGGFRQIGKVIPLIQQFATAQQALTVAQNASGSVAKDAAIAQQGLGNQIAKVREEFTALIRKFTDSGPFNSIATGALKIASAMIKVAEAVEPLLPLLTTMFGLKLGRALAPGLGQLAGIGRGSRGGGGGFSRFARGGMVPGSGNRDTVPAMLTPGEFVIKKSSVKSLGANTLAQMNNNRFGRGGVISTLADDFTSAANRKRVLRSKTLTEGQVSNAKVQMNASDRFSANLATEYLPSRVPKRDSKGRAFRNAGKQISDAKFEDLAQRRFGGRDGGGEAMDLIGGDMPTEVKRTKGNVPNSMLLDKLIRSFMTQGVKNTGGQGKLTGKSDDLKLRGMRVVYSDQKKDLKPRTAISLGESLVQPRTRKNAGGGISGSDTVPALLTPGEFVFNKSAAKSIGHATLSRMNKQGVQGFAKGGPVGFANGGPVDQVSGAGSAADILKAAEDEIDARKKSSEEIKKNTAEEKKNTNESTKGTQGLKNYTGTLSKAKEKLNQFASRVQGGAASLSRVAQSAQSFVFLGASIGAVTAQMSGLEDSTKKAINETTAFIGGVVGIGATVIETFSSIVSSTILQTTASNICTEATLKEAAAKGINTQQTAKIATGMGKFAAGLGGVAAGVGIVLTAATYYGAKQRAVADELATGVNEALKKIGEGAGANADELTQATKEEIEARKRSAAVSGTEGLAIIGGVAAAAGTTAATFAAFGTTLGPVGVAVAGFAGALVGGGLALFGVKTAAEKLIHAKQEELAAINASITGIINLRSGIYDLQNALGTIDSAAGLSDEVRLDKRIAATAGVGSLSASSIETQNIQARKQLESLTAGTGKTFQGLSEKDFEDNEDAAAKFKFATELMAESVKAAEARFKATSETFQLAMQTADPSKTFAELSTQAGPYKSALDAQIASIKLMTGIQIQAAEQQLRALNATGANEKEIEAQNKKLQSLKDSQDALINNTLEGAEAAQKVANAQYEAARRTREASIALARSLVESGQFFDGLNKQLQSLEGEALAIDNFNAALDGAVFKFKEINIDEIDNLTNVRDLNTFAKQLGDAAKGAGPEAQKYVDQLTANASAFKRAQQGGLLGLEQQLSDDAGAGQTEKILKDLGFSADTLGGGELGQKVFEEMQSQLTKALEDGVVDANELKAILGPAEQANAQAVDAAKKLVEIRQKEITNLQANLAAQEKLRQKEIEFREAQIDAIRKGVQRTEKAQEILAKSIDPSAEFTPQRGVETRLQNINAQNRLNTLGMGLQAGDVGGVTQTRRNAQRRQEEIRKEIEAGGLSVEKTKALMEEQDKLRTIINTTGDELKRLSDRSSEAADIQGAMEQNLRAIEKERRAREQVTGVIEDFVIGGVEARRGLVEAATGVRQAFASGTLQMQTPEQRQATVGLLDRLGDVQLAGGMTGKEIKQELVFRDAVRLGLDPELAQAIATGTSTEEQLIDANRDLAQKMEQLTVATLLASQGLGNPAGNFATGGMVQYRAGGGSIFKPKGTDTVPAMLSPGEFVIRKSAVDAIGADALSAINDGGGAVAYRNTGSKKPEGKLSWWEKALGFYERKPGEEESESSKAFKKLGSGLDLANVPKRLGVPEGGMFDGKFIAEGLKPYGSGPSGQELMDQRAGFQAGRDAGAKTAAMKKTERDMQTTAAPKPQTMASLPTTFQGQPINSSYLGQHDEFMARGQTVGQDFDDIGQRAGEFGESVVRAYGSTPSGGERFRNRERANYGDFGVGELGDAIFKKGEENIKAAERHRRAMIAPSTHVDASTSTSYLTKPLHMLTGPELKQRNERIAKNKAGKKARDKQAQDESLERGIAGMHRKAEELRAQSIADGTSTETHHGLFSTGNALTNVNADHLFELGPVAGLGLPSGGEMGQALKDQDAARAIGSDLMNVPDYLGGEGKGGLSWRFATPQGLGREIFAAGGAGDAVTQFMFGAPPPDRSETETERLLRERRERKPERDAAAERQRKDMEEYNKQLESRLESDLETDRIRMGRSTAEEHEKYMEESRAKLAALDAQIEAGGSPEFLEKQAKRERDEKFRRDLEGDEQKRFKAQMARLEEEGASSRLGETEEDKKARDLARIRELRKETITMPDGTTRKLTSSEISDQLAEEASKATFTNRQLEVMGRTSGFFGSEDDGVGAIGKFGLDMKFDDEGILVAGDASNRSKPKPMPKVGKLTHEQFLKAQQTRADRTRKMKNARKEGDNKQRLIKAPGAKFGSSIQGRGRYKKGFFNRQQRLDRLREEREARKAEVQELKEQRAMNAHTKGVDIQDNDTVADTYQRILRTNGPVIAKRYADSVGYKPPSRFKFARPQNRDRQLQGSSNTDQLLQQLLQQMVNRGGRPQGFASGGSAAGSDVIPAMLTPGEFVMSAGAVRQHGVGAMRSLNKGQVPGFNRGGMVGGVAYRANGSNGAEFGGGGISINTGNLDESFSNFVGNFSSELDKITGVFSPMAQALQNLAKIFGGEEGIKMNHVHTVTIAAGSAEGKLDAQTIDQIGKLAADYVKPLLPDGNDFNVA